MSGNKDIEQLLVEYIKSKQASFFRLATSYVRNEDDALDIIQNAVVKALSNQNSLKHKEYIKTWFYRILINECLMFIRKNKDISFSPIEDYQGSSHQFEDHVENVLDINSALDIINPKFKTVIVLRYFEELKITEIAEITNTNVNTVKTRLYKGLEILKGMLN